MSDEIKDKQQSSEGENADNNQFNEYKNIIAEKEKLIEEQKRLREEKEKELNLAQERIIKLRQKKREQIDDEEEDEEPEDKEERNRKIKAEIKSELQKEQAIEYAQVIAKQNNFTQEETETLLKTFQTKIVPSGNFKSDVDTAFSIIAHEKIKQQLEEIKRANNSEDQVNGFSPQGQTNMQSNIPKNNYSPKDRAFIQKNNIEVDKQTGKVISKNKKAYMDRVRKNPELTDLNFDYVEE